MDAAKRTTGLFLGTAAIAMAGGTVDGVTDTPTAALIGWVLVALAGVLGVGLDRAWSTAMGRRAYLAALLPGLGVLLAQPAPELQAATVVGFALAATLGGAWEEERAAAAGWTLFGVATYVAGNLARGIEPAGALQATLEFAVVPAGLSLLAHQAWTMTRSLSNALAQSEIARSKLLRSNRALGGAMERTEAALGKLGTIMDNLAEGLVAVTVDGKVELANAALARMLEVEAIEEGTLTALALPSELQGLVQTCLQRSEVSTREVALGGDRTALATASPIRIKGALWGAAVLVRDVTLQREIDRMKNDFAATVSHEMRTPLTSVLGFTKLIQGQLEKRVFPVIPEDDKRAQKAARTVSSNLGVIAAESERLSELIRDVLDLSRLESGQAIFEPEPIHPADLARAAVEVGLAMLRENADVRIEVDVPDDLPRVHADPERILGVLQRLISNAVKFTDQGVIRLSARQGFAMMEFSVQDSGIGIRPAHRDLVFEKFRQVGDVLTDRPTGTGLGLPICRQIITLHGGTIWVEGKRDEGATFRFTLPIHD